MKIKYLGPSPWVNVHPYGPHYQNEVKEYPGEFGLELLATSFKQHFEVVETKKAGAATQATGKKKAAKAKAKK